LLSGSLLCQLKVMTGSISSSKAFCDLALALSHRGGDRGPNIAHAKRDKGNERNQLSDQSEINIHTLLLWCSGDTFSAPRKKEGY
jgi:hypothetical protein